MSHSGRSGKCTGQSRGRGRGRGSADPVPTRRLPLAVCRPSPRQAALTRSSFSDVQIEPVPVVKKQEDVKMNPVVNKRIKIEPGIAIPLASESDAIQETESEPVTLNMKEKTGEIKNTFIEETESNLVKKPEVDNNFEPKKKEITVKGPVLSKRKTIIPKSDLWADRFKPKKVQDIVGNPGAWEQLRSWIVRKNSNNRQCPKLALIHGPPGVGKTSMASLMLEECGYNVQEVNASTRRTAKDIMDDIWTYSMSSGLVGNRRTALVLDEFDGVYEGSESLGDTATSGYGTISTMLRKLPRAASPVICICNDFGDRQALRKFASEHCEIIRVFPLWEKDLRTMVQKYGQFGDVDSLISLAAGDARKLWILLEQEKNLSTADLPTVDPLPEILKSNHVKSLCTEGNIENLWKRLSQKENSIFGSSSIKADQFDSIFSGMGRVWSQVSLQERSRIMNSDPGMFLTGVHRTLTMMEDDSNMGISCNREVDQTKTIEEIGWDDISFVTPEDIRSGRVKRITGALNQRDAFSDLADSLSVADTMWDYRGDNPEAFSKVTLASDIVGASIGRAMKCQASVWDGKGSGPFLGSMKLPRPNIGRMSLNPRLQHVQEDRGMYRTLMNNEMKSMTSEESNQVLSSQGWEPETLRWLLDDSGLGACRGTCPESAHPAAMPGWYDNFRKSKEPELVRLS